MLVMFPQFIKAKSPILVTLLGIIIFFKLLQLENAEKSMLVTLSGIIISFKTVQ